MEEHRVTRLVLFTDEPVLASGLEVLLRSQNELKLVAICPRLAEIEETVAATRPDILLIDLTPEVTFELMLHLQVQSPQIRIVLWAHAIAAEMAYQAIEHGIRGILRKTLAPEALTNCLRIVADGGIWFDEVLETTLRGLTTIHLTPRESQIVSLLTSGLKNKELATALFLSEGTVKVYLSKLFRKLGVKDRFELALLGLANMAGTKRTESAGQTRETTLLRMNAGPAPFVHRLVMGRTAYRA